MRNRTRVKICGITRLEDAQSAVEAGADAIGLVFYEKSPRYVSIPVAKQIVESMSPFVNCVGLFVDANVEQIKQVLDETGIDTLQFHGHETAEACALYGRPYIKAIRMTVDVDLVQIAKDYASASALLLDTFVQGVPGGTGQVFDWSRIPEQTEKPVILAGGLNVEYVK